MLKLSRNGIGALSALYRSVLRKCLLLNMFIAGAFAFVPAADATVYDSATSSTFQYMGTMVNSGDVAYVYGDGGYNTSELFSQNTAYKDAWLQNNKGEIYFGKDTSGFKVLYDTIISNKHNITHYNNDATYAAASNGGGAISNMDGGYTVEIYKTKFINNSDTRFLDDSSNPQKNVGLTAGGALNNYSQGGVTIENSTFSNNYVMHYNNAFGGAVYNGSNLEFGITPVYGTIFSTDGNYVNNHAGNEWINGASVGVTNNILNVWKQNSDDASSADQKGEMTKTAAGGAIYNTGEYFSYGNGFEGNYAIGDNSMGGAIYNDRNKEYGAGTLTDGFLRLEKLNTFVGNYAGKGLAIDLSTMYGTKSKGGAIYNNYVVEILDGEDDQLIFGTSTSNGNYAVATSEAAGGAIYNDTEGTIDAIRANSRFIGNYAHGIGSGNALGGAIANYGKIILDGGTYQNNKAYTDSTSSSALGGAIYNDNSGTITLNISEDSIFASNSAQLGGAIYNEGTIGGAVQSDAKYKFEGNVAQNGGAIYNKGTINTTFSGNSLLEFSGNIATAGSSIYNDATGNITFTIVDNAKIHFGQNQSVHNAGKVTISNSTVTSVPSISLTAVNNTEVLLDTTLYSANDSSTYDINGTKLTLSSTGFIDSSTALNLKNNNIVLESGSYMNLNSGNDNLYNKANNFTVASGSNLEYKNQLINPNGNYFANTIANSGTVTYYGYANYSDVYVADTLINSKTLNAAADKLLTNIHIDNLTSNSGNEIVINLRNNENNTASSEADIIVIDNTIYGTPTEVVFHDMTDTEVSTVYLGEGERIYFAKTQVNQTGGYADLEHTFTTDVTGAGYEIKVGYTNEFNSSVYDWFLYRGNAIDPALDPEDIALIDLPRAALEQTRSIMLPVARTNRGQCNCYQDNCDNSFCRYEASRIKRRFWATPIYRKGTYDKPIKTDFDLKGIDFGLDVQGNPNDMIGIFGSYRYGEYENDGNKDQKYFSHFGSELDITSLIGGLYFREYMGNLYLMGAVYGGKLDVDLKTKTGVKASIDGRTIGAQGAVGYDVRLTHREILTPSLTATYNYIKFDDVKDVNHKEASISAVNNVELEAALKYEYQFNNEYQLPTTGYLKPSVIQTIASGGKVKIDDREYDDTIENDTLGRIEIGGDAEIIKNFSIGAFGNYTFGSEYKAWGIGGNIRYVW